jgi:hypothetical protein
VKNEIHDTCVSQGLVPRPKEGTNEKVACRVPNLIHSYRSVELVGCPANANASREGELIDPASLGDLDISDSRIGVTSVVATLRPQLYESNDAQVVQKATIWNEQRLMNVSRWKEECEVCWKGGEIDEKGQVRSSKESGL